MNTSAATPSEQFPVLVYGTLRPTGSNYNYFLRGQTTYEQNVRLDGFAMFSAGGFPYLTRGDQRITATLVVINPEDYVATLRSLDFLEGFRGEGNYMNHYDRVLHTFEHDGESITAWIYVISDGNEEYVKGLPPVASGDWLVEVWENELSAPAELTYGSSF